MVWERWTALLAKSQASLTDPTPPKPPMTPEQKQALLRKMRNTSIMMGVLNWAIAVGVIVAVYVQYGDVTVTLIVAVLVIAYMIYHTWKHLRIGRK